MPIVILCPGQGAQAVGMGKKWYEASATARAVFDEADSALGDSLGFPLTQLCFEGPAERLNQTDVSQPAIYVCSVACYRALARGDCNIGESNTDDFDNIVAAAGLSLGEYTALHIAGAFQFVDGLKLVARRGRLMQDAAIASRSGMIAIIGADETQAQTVCDKAAQGGVLVCANFNAPGQIVLSGDQAACDRANQVASDMGLKASPLTVAGAFHSPLMQPAADQMADALAATPMQIPRVQVWSNVTAQPHSGQNNEGVELLRQRLVEQIVKPVRWSQSCQSLVSDGQIGENTAWHEMAPGGVLRGLMRRIDRNIKVTSHDEP